MILNAGGRPEPPTHIVERIHRIHPSLGLRFTPRFDGEWWSVIGEWDENDPRRERVKCGELPPDMAFDLIAQLPLDCSAEEAFGFIEQNIVRSSVPNIRRHIDRIHEYNKVGQDKIVEETFVEAVAKTGTEIGDAEAAKVGGKNYSYAGLGDSPLGKRKKKRA